MCCDADLTPVGSDPVVVLASVNQTVVAPSRLPSCRDEIERYFFIARPPDRPPRLMGWSLVEQRCLMIV